MAFEHQSIKNYKHWNLYLHENQCYLGRAYLWANREDALDFADMTSAEQEELFKIVRQLKNVLDNLFKPDLYNYASLGNICNHLHIHIIPRYSDSRLFKGQEFYDKRWGQNYSPYDQTFDIGDARFQELKLLLKNNLDEFDFADA